MTAIRETIDIEIESSLPGEIIVEDVNGDKIKILTAIEDYEQSEEIENIATTEYETTSIDITFPTEESIIDTVVGNTIIDDYENINEDVDVVVAKVDNIPAEVDQDQIFLDSSQGEEEGIQNTIQVY